MGVSNVARASRLCRPKATNLQTFLPHQPKATYSHTPADSLASQ
jgi:hypothetical protein